MIYMDGLMNLVGDDYERGGYEDILETAKLLSGNDPEVVKAMEYALGDPKSYLAERFERFYERGLCFVPENAALYDALFYAMTDELMEYGYFTDVKWKCSRGLFLQELGALKNYELIADAVQKAAEYFIYGDFPSDWGGTVNAAAGGKAYICKIEPPNNGHYAGYSMIILDGETLKKVQDVCDFNKNYIKEYDNMGLYGYDPLKNFFGNYDREDGEDIIETVKLISDNDPWLTREMTFAVNNPEKYVKGNAERLSKRGIELDDPESFEELDADELLFLVILDELEKQNYVYEFDRKCGLVDFLCGLERIKNYDLIADVIKTLRFNERGSIEAWGKAINAAIDKAWGGDPDKKAVLCYMDIDSDSYPLIILTCGTLGALPLPFIMAM